MFKSKSAMFGIVAALVAGSLLVAGMAVTTTQGAPTDPIPAGLGEGLGNWTLPTDGGNPGQPGGPVTAPPPAGPVEPPSGTTNPVTNPSGAPASNASGPGSLPNAGFGAGSDGSGLGTLMVLVGLAGVALVGAGASAVSSKRNG